MKKVCFLFVGTCFLSFGSLQAQNVLGAAQKAAAATTTLGNSGGIANNIMGSLTPTLGLNNTQQPKVLDMVSGFLKKKSEITPLQQTNPTAYTSKFSGLQGGLFSKLKGVLTAAQYAKFLGLKPKASDATNVLSQLFF
ncbi:hypothetical protein CLV59_104428 [Chitinophaga dinghuensis]|uniref:DUF2780 domain-containing protein n=1 Tax=Chitinophaga dinghuensis TaxID=1539050 RepID=A0A327W0N4_9BACT|nr:hypothetical protein [Chitinophaga dinghuensis]RAJ82203.1 hypothetical protein CLV59_104428 [Chitinophaga dinghuensis]